MRLSCFRITKRERVAEAFDGEGARLYGGRWNSKGKRVVYTSASKSLAILETLVHLDSHELLAQLFCFIESTFPEQVCEVLDPRTLQSGWDNDIPIGFTQQVGDRWLSESRSAVLAVPSVLSPDESNYLLNPEHRDFAKIAMGPPKNFAFSRRFLK